MHNIGAEAPRGSPTQTREIFLRTEGEDDSPYQGEMARRARGDRELPLPPHPGNFPILGGPVWDRPLRKAIYAVGAALAAARREGTVSHVGAAHWAARRLRSRLGFA